jgi:host factor-I protein
LREILYVKIKISTRRKVMSNAGKGLNLQDNYLNQLRKEKIPVVIYLTNGVRLKGTIKSFDNFVILLKENTESLLYKHAVSTIVPEKDIEIRFEEQP